MPSSESSNSLTDSAKALTPDKPAAPSANGVSNINRVVIWMLRLLVGGVFVMSGLT